jgi:hypothetical protein
MPVGKANLQELGGMRITDGTIPYTINQKEEPK